VIYDFGKLVSPPVTAFSGVLWGTAAYLASSQGSGDGRLYAIAGLLSFGVLPWTVLVMMPVNQELMRRAKVEDESAKFMVESKQSLASWDSMNYVRAVLPMVGAWVGLYAALK
jgi:hypothetical protein